ncbi:MAG: TetR/AcrR family transcriptional regulator, partial [Spirochaetes bacterium]
NFNYYDIMFSPSLPKYNDYMGTPYEALSRIEMDYSRKIIDLAMDMVSAVLESSPETERAAAERYMIEVWSMLHGMILLQNSTLATYVVSDPMKVYAHIVDDIIRVIKR